MLFNMVPGSRTKPAVVKPQCGCLSCVANGLIFMGLVLYMGCLFTAAIKNEHVKFFSLICVFRMHSSPSGWALNFLAAPFFLLYIYDICTLKLNKCSLSGRLFASTPFSVSQSY